MFNSYAPSEGGIVTLQDSTAFAELSFFAYNSTTTTNTIAGDGGNFALFDSTAKKRAFSVYKSTASNISFAYVNSTADNESVAFNASKAGSLSFAMEQSIATTQSFAHKLSIANAASVALYDSSANDNSFAAYNSSADDGGIAAFSSIDDDCAGIALFNSENRIYKGDAYMTTTAYHSTAMFNSKNIYDGTSEFKLTYEEYQQPTTRVAATEQLYNSITKFDSTACADFSLTYYNSKNVFSDYSIAMYDSSAIATSGAASKSTDGKYGVSFTNAVFNIAMYNSSIKEDAFKIKLWSNSITIEPSGYINSAKYIDLTLPRYKQFKYKQAEYGPILSKGYKLMIIG